MLSAWKLGFFVVIFEECVFGQLYVDDYCTISKTGQSGVCKLFNDCPTAIEAFRNRRVIPENCGYQGQEPIICCPPALAQAKPKREPGEISRKKCAEYTKFLYETSRSPVLLIRPQTITKKECGHVVETLIIGGVKAKRREFPHMAAVGFEKTPGDVKWLCGGTILSENYVLTAGHCLRNRDAGEAKYVQLGVADLNDKSSHKQQIKVQDAIRYPDYKSSSHYHDIGLLKLETPADLNSYAVPACLYPTQQINAEKAIATGWGDTAWAGTRSNDLLKVTLDLFDHKTCNDSYDISKRLRNGILDDIQICAGSLDPDKSKDTCQGDSGGPLQIYHIGDNITCMYDIIGVTSFGKACSASAGVYVRISHYIKWIEDHVWPEDA